MTLKGSKTHKNYTFHPEDPNKKRCSGCKEYKELKYFNISRSQPSGLTSRCKECVSKSTKTPNRRKYVNKKQSTSEHKEYMRAYRATPEYKEWDKARQSSPEYREQVNTRQNTSEHRRLQSEYRQRPYVKKKLAKR